MPIRAGPEARTQRARDHRAEEVTTLTIFLAAITIVLAAIAVLMARRKRRGS
jgi:hypothetical protein